VTSPAWVVTCAAACLGTLIWYSTSQRKLTPGQPVSVSRSVCPSSRCEVDG
jgi:hypothetical protein